ncbi:Adaptor protein complex AP-3, beta subunit [Penicillium ucsense]|uniref:Adaptor protein complex AP-3, beta subunit n=1 Tax=Penicillium ucsense TaxID=2839758 RepID=A0A8J8WJ04_9EURO|nr:Adaptor protein complex AP-3, beta subunit [Penicillium ucsense]KAF7735611.1 Adaptor protein complex AP-3, beta subunit [Penicillium ucsense]
METISRISSMLETARELTLEAAQAAASNRSSNPDYGSRIYSVSHIKKLLDSRHEREVLDGMRRVISLMYRSEPSLPFFSAVVKNAATPNLEVKKLVYIYLVHHAEAEPDLALLSINAIQKSLTDQNPQIRTMALRTMSGIRVPVISQIVSLAIKRGCGDMSPHVRKAAALAIPKCYRLDPNTLPQLIGYLSTLLGDPQYFVVGPAVAAFLEVCPDQIDLIHKHYRGLVKKLVDMDEWGQLATLRLLTIYARKCFPRKSQKIKQAVTTKSFYDDDEGQVQGEPVDGAEYEVQLVDPDLELLLRACKLLLQNRNSAVIVSVVRCFFHLAPPDYLQSAIGPLVALLRCPQDMQHIALYNIVAVALRDPRPFTKYISRFLVHASDPLHIWRLKLEILTILFPCCGQHWKSVIISELEHFSASADPELVRESVRAIGRCAQGDANTADLCLRILLSQISSLDGNLVSESLTVIRHLIQQDPPSHKQTVIKLVSHLGTTTNPDARATIIWLVGEFAGVDPGHNIAPDVLRVLIRSFADETEIVKQQVVLLGAKVYLHHLLQKSSTETPDQALPSIDNATATRLGEAIENEWTSEQRGNEFHMEGTQQSGEAEETANEENEDRITMLWRYILLLARYDPSYDLRDRARLYKALLATPSSTQLANLLLLAPKPVPHAPSPSETRKDLLIGTATLVIGQEAGHHGLRGYANLPDWVEPGQEPDSSLRAEEIKPETSTTLDASMTAGARLDRALREHKSIVPPQRSGGGVGGAISGKKTLDQWLDEEEETDSESETEEETDSEEETGSEEDSEDGSEEDDSEDEDDDSEVNDTDSETEAVHKEAEQLLK